ncbi:hypothetical protein ScPMuIL_015379 [Solemya velum]
MAESLEAQLETIAQESAFLKKYFSLRKKCEQIQQANEKLVNRLQHVKKIVKRYKRERRFLVNKLDDHGDSYRDAQVPVMWEDNLWRPPPPYPGHSRVSEDKQGGQDKPSTSMLSSIHPLLQAHGMGDSKTRKLKSEKEKEAGAPKKPANAFLMFCQQRRAAVQQQYFNEHHEDIAHHELTKRLATEWNGLDSDDKQVYFDMYELEKERYEKELKEYTELGYSHIKKEPITNPENQYSEATMAAMNLEAQSAVSALMIKVEDND